MNIRRLAVARGISLNRLADFAGVGRRHLFSVLAGDHDPTLGWCARVAAALDVDLVQLLSVYEPGWVEARQQTPAMAANPRSDDDSSK